MPVIEISLLTRRFDGFTAVDAVTMATEQGETFGLLGPNGAGKTTVIKMLTTLLPPTAGEAKVAGFDIVHQAAEVRRSIGYVPQMLSADGTLTGYENLWVFASLYDVPRAERESRIRDALAFMGLEEAADKLVRTYSGGMSQAPGDQPIYIAPPTGTLPRRADDRAGSNRTQDRVGAYWGAEGAVPYDDIHDHARDG